MFELHLILHLSLFAAGAWAILWSFRNSGDRDRNEILGAYVVAYLARMAATLAIHPYSPDGLFFFDDRGYDQQAGLLAFSPAMSLSLMQSQVASFHIGYQFLVSLVYKAAGHSVLSGEMLNAFLGAATVPIAYCLTLEIVDDVASARIVLWTSALFLFDIAWSAFLLKDTALLFLITAACLCAAKALRRHSLVWFSCLSLLTVVVCLFRFYAATALIIAFAVAAVALVVRQSATFAHHRWPVFIIASAALIATGWRLFSWLGSHTVLGDDVSIGQINHALRVAGFNPLVFSPSAEYVRRVLMAAFVYFLGPFPWIFWGNVDRFNFIFYPGMYLIYALFPFFVAGLWQFIRRLDPAAMFVAMVILLHAAAEMYAYQGAERQRMMTDALFIICAAVGWRVRYRTPVLVHAVYGVLVLVMCGRMAAELFASSSIR